MQGVIWIVLIASPCALAQMSLTDQINAGDAAERRQKIRDDGLLGTRASQAKSVRAANSGARAKLLEIRFVGEKRNPGLVGLPKVAMDRHLDGFLAEAGIGKQTYALNQDVIYQAADTLKVERAHLITASGGISGARLRSALEGACSGRTRPIRPADPRYSGAPEGNLHALTPQSPADAPSDSGRASAVSNSRPEPAPTAIHRMGPDAEPARPAASLRGRRSGAEVE